MLELPLIWVCSILAVAQAPAAEPPAAPPAAPEAAPTQATASEAATAPDPPPAPAPSTTVAPPVPAPEPAPSTAVAPPAGLQSLGVASLSRTLELLMRPQRSAFRRPLVPLGQEAAVAEVPELLAQMSVSPDPAVRLRALEGWAQSNNPQRVDAFLAALGDPSERVRRAAAGYLAAGDVEAAQRYLTRLFMGGDPRVQALVDPVLPDLARALGPRLLEVLAAPGTHVMERRVAAYLLGRMGYAEGAAVLTTCARDADPDTALGCAQSLAALRAPDAVPLWVEFLQHQDPRMPYLAVQALQMIGGPDALAAVRTVATGESSQDPGLQRHALEALATWPPAEAVPALVAAMRNRNVFQQAVNHAQRLTGAAPDATPAAWEEWLQGIQPAAPGAPPAPVPATAPATPFVGPLPPEPPAAE